jgi:signal transduction histidine kinase
MAATETILIIDDDELLRRPLRLFLRNLGLSVTEAADGELGLAEIRRQAPALVLLDVTLPGENGFEICRAIRALPGAGDTPVILMTALEGHAGRQEAFLCGAVDYVPKPLVLEDVAIRIKTHLGIRQQGIELRESRDRIHRAYFDLAAMNRNLVEVNEKLRRSEEVKTRFLALMRNEINNPLTDIMGMADLIAGKVPLDKARELAAMIKGDAFQLDCQIRNVFCAAALEAGEAGPAVERVDVASVLQDIVGSFAPIARTKGLALRFLLEGEASAFPTDGEMLHHILANLVANAVECSWPSGQVEIRAKAGEEGLKVAVADQGPGLPEAQRRKLLQPFGASVGATSQRGQSLGLPVVKALVDLLSGNLQVESSPGEGTTIVVSLPKGACLGDLDGASLDGNLLIFDEPKEF